jgi:hypothetical protein
MHGQTFAPTPCCDYSANKRTSIPNLFEMRNVPLLPHLCIQLKRVFSPQWEYYDSKLLSSVVVCGLVVRVPGYRSRGPGSIPRGIRFSE